jgi:hypothetical protein
MSKKKYATLGLAVAAFAGFAAMTAAEARPGHGGGHGGHHHHYRGYRYYGPVVPVYPLVSSCDYSRMMWRRTGRTYWKIRYYDCMGW